MDDCLSCGIYLHLTEHEVLLRHTVSAIHQLTPIPKWVAQSCSFLHCRLVLSAKKVDPVSAHFLRQSSVALVQVKKLSRVSDVILKFWKLKLGGIHLIWAME